MNHRFCPLLPKDPLRPPVLVLAAHPDDEVIGAGGMLAWHRRQGHAVTVVHMTDGARGDPSGKCADIKAARRAEGEAALRALDITDLQHWDQPDGELPEHAPALQARLCALLAAVAPRTLYSFWFGEAHRDHRAVAWLTAVCAQALPADCRCLLFGVNQPPPGGALFDVTAEHAAKLQALRAYRSQLVYCDLAELSDHRDRAATINIDVPGVRHAELFADLRPAQLATARSRAEAMQQLLLGDDA